MARRGVELLETEGDRRGRRFGFRQTVWGFSVDSLPQTLG